MHDTASSAMAYVSRGWAVVPLHDVTGGTCSCGSADPKHDAKQGGKHPLFGGWQNAGLRTAAAVADQWARRPGANVGIVTGRASGLWVLDVDPDNGGDVKLAGLVATYGVLPETYTVRTGSGGLHYYWRMPGFDFTTSRGQLPVGLDVRGNAGQVVAPPSYTLKGPYEAVADVALVDAPGWMLGLIKPPPAPEPRERGPYEFDLPTGNDQGRGAAYARSAVSGALAALARAEPGARNDTAYRTGRRLAELLNSSWSGLDAAAVFEGFMAAAAACDIDGGFSQAEAYDTLRKAIRDQGQRGVDLPASETLGTFLPWDFSPAGQGPALGSVAATDQVVEGMSAVLVVPDAFEQAVQRKAWDLAVLDAARERLRVAREPAWSLKIMNRDEQARMERVAPLIAGWVGQGQVARIYGPPGAGKSFVGVEMAACVSTGRAWHGCRVSQGEVVYFAVEDAPGVALRLQAWERSHGVEHRVHLVSTPIRMDIPTVQKVLDAVRAYFGEARLALIVLDTQAMVTVGMDENSATDMGLFVEAVKLLATQTGATVMVVHHSGVRGGRARGSTSVLGAMDVELEAAMAGTTVTLTSTKQKNVARPAPLLATLNVVDMGEVDDFGLPVTSCVLVAAADTASAVEMGPFIAPTAPVLTGLQRRALAIAAVLSETAATGETYARVRVRAGQMTSFGSTSGSVTAQFSKAWAYLVERGRVAKAIGRDAYYFIDLDGEDRLAANPRKLVSGGPEAYVPVDA